jgi:VanZ family protein
MKILGRWGPVLIWMALIFFVSAQSQLPTPEQRWLDILLEKSGHTLEYAVLAVLLVRALDPAQTGRWRAFGVAVLIAWLYAISDEIHQMFVPGRSADWLDILFDWMGAMVATLLALALHVWARNRSSVSENA